MNSSKNLDVCFQDMCAAVKTLFKNGFTETEIMNEVLLAIGECEDEQENESEGDV